MADITGLLNNQGIAEASPDDRRRIIAQFICDYVVDHDVLLEREVHLALGELARESPDSFNKSFVQKGSKPPFNQYIGELGIKYMGLKEAILAATRGKNSRCKRKIVYDTRGRILGKGTSLHNSIIFYKDIRALKGYILEMLSGTELIAEYTIRVPNALIAGRRG